MSNKTRVVRVSPNLDFALKKVNQRISPKNNRVSENIIAVELINNIDKIEEQYKKQLKKRSFMERALNGFL